MKFKSSLLVVGFVIVTFGLSQAQENTPAEKSGSAELLSKLQSKDLTERYAALDALRSDPAALRDPDVKPALVNLLDRENHQTISGEEEEYAEYVSWLAETVAKVVDWNDPHQVCILADSVDLPDELADHAKASIPCLLRRYKNASSLMRGPIVATMVQALAKGEKDLEPTMIQTVQGKIVSALKDRNAGVKIDVIKALGEFGKADMILVLSEVAENDPDPYDKKLADKAIVAIHQRTQQQQTPSARH